MCNSPSAPAIAPWRSRWTTRTIARIALVVSGSATVLATTPRVVAAQDSAADQTRWEFLVNSGSVLPSGAQRQAIQRAKLSAAQLSYVVNPTLAVTATVGWARSRDIATAGDPRLNVFTYDLGAEVRARRHVIGGGLTLRPFVGAGAGARSYDYRSLDAAARHNVAAYASAGGELGLRRVRLRVEVRDYVTGFKPLVGSGATRTRNDVAIMAGLRITSR